MPDDGYAKSVLVTTEWVAEHLDDHGGSRGRGRREPDVYDEGHIRGAVKLHWRDDLQDPVERDLVSRDVFERCSESAGSATTRSSSSTATGTTGSPPSPTGT